MDKMIQLIQNRRSIDKFDPSKEIPKELLKQLIELGAQSPSSFNLQHWRFIAVIDKKNREKLYGASGQQKILDASATLIVLGDLRAVEKFPEKAEKIMRFYADPRKTRDEAIRSASLAAMTIMLAAEAHGLVTCSMIGFDPEKLVKAFEIDSRYLPIMLLAMGYEAPGNWPKKSRLGLEEILKII